MIFENNKFGLVDDFSGLIVVKALTWVRIQLENIEVYHSDQVKNSHILKFIGMYDYEADFVNLAEPSASFPIWAFD